MDEGGGERKREDQKGSEAIGRRKETAGGAKGQPTGGCAINYKSRRSAASESAGGGMRVEGVEE